MAQKWDFGRLVPPTVHTTLIASTVQYHTIRVSTTLSCLSNHYTGHNDSGNAITGGTGKYARASGIAELVGNDGEYFTYCTCSVCAMSVPKMIGGGCMHGNAVMKTSTRRD